MANPPDKKRFVHADLQLPNVLLAPGSYEYSALIDWGCAQLSDSAVDFIFMPLSAVPFLLAGHRELELLDKDETAEARIVYRRIQLILRTLPATNPGEDPKASLKELLDFFRRPPTDGPWRELAPGNLRG